VCLLTGIGLQQIARLNAHLTERYYSRGLYPYIVRALSSVNRRVAFSLGEVLLLLALGCVAACLAWYARQFYRQRAAWRSLLASLGRRVVWTGSVGLILFMLLFGLNYQRPSLAETLGYGRGETREEELELVGRHIVAEINQSYREAHAGRSNSQSTLNRKQLVAAIEEAYRQQTTLADVNPEGYGPPKPAYFSRILTRLGITGIYLPFSGEPNFNAEQPAFDLPFTIAHEMAHQRGYAREDEANFAAFLVCISSAQPFVRYSGYLNALDVLGALWRICPGCSREIFNGLEDGPRADLKARSAFWSRYQGRTSLLGRRINNVYLKANRVKSGVKNYDDVVSLIVGYYRLRPVTVNSL